MNMLKKVALGIIAVVSLTVMSNSAHAQFSPGPGFKQLNFGLESYDFGVYLGLDIGVADLITIGPRLNFEYDSKFATFGFGEYDRTVFIPSFRGDFHYGGLITGLPSELDLYAGLSLGIAFVHIDWEDPNLSDNSDSDVQAWLQIGARWYFNEKWGANLEFAGGSLTNAAIGLSYRF